MSSVHTISAPPTYGELAAASFQLVAQARLHDCGPFATRQQADDAVVGYERFLGVAGRHLQLLAAPGLANLDSRHPDIHQALPELVRRLTQFKITSTTDSLWGRAADRLGVAHDLLATHVGPFGQALTPDAVLLADPDIRQAATTRLLAMTVPPLAVSGTLLANVTAFHLKPRPARWQTALLERHAPRLRQLVEDIVPREDLHVRPAAQLVAVDALSPAGHHLVNAVNARRQFENSLAALQVLRLLSFRQSNGEHRASPGSLRDLARVAAHVTTIAETRLPTPSTPLGRVRRATAVDSLDAAGAAWNDAGAALGPQLRGLDRAPRVYADATEVLRDRTADDPTLASAVMAALPRLGNDAAITIDSLVANHRLVVATRPPARFQAVWRPLNQDEGAALAQKFAAAATASHQANMTLKESTEAPPARANVGRIVDTPSIARQRRRPAAGVTR